ncbi:MAG: hypothetical protein P4L57_09840 [Rhizomicrobium sp.]|nr:hypothetical protein [Rhizomicrobium sp.]
MKIALVIASRGRPQLLAAVLRHWAEQSCVPNCRVISLSSPGDIEELSDGLVEMVLVGTAGLCLQRNRALDALMPSDTEIVIFVDDDYIPSRNFVQNVSELFSHHHDIAVATGKMLADGVTCGGIDYTAAVRMVEKYDAMPEEPPWVMVDRGGGYGCNMVIRWSANRTIRCDERLPLYGWQEDVDYTRQYLSYGRIVDTNAFAGVHMGSQGARSPGKRLGYSQIVNPVYLMRKGTMPAWLGIKIMINNVLANLRGTMLGDAKVDRGGRLKGNLLGIAHILLGRLMPEYVLKL